MAGPFWGSIGQGFFQGQDQADQRQAYRAMLLKQKQQDEQEAKTNAGMGAGIQALQPPPQMQPPPPGQQSMPMQPPPQQQRPPMQGQMPPPPGGQGQGGSGIPAMGGGQFSGPPPLQGAPGGQAPLRPYQGPQAPPQQPQPQGQGQGIPPPPGQPQQPQGGVSLQALMKKLTDQGMDGQTAFQVAHRFEPMLNQEGKMQLASATMEIRRLQAEAAEKKADTGAKAEDRHQAFDSGTSARGQVTVAKGKAATDELGARADRERRQGTASWVSPKKGSGSGGAGAAGSGEGDAFFLAREVGGDSAWKTGMSRAETTRIMKGLPAFAKEHDIAPEEIGTASATRKALTTGLRNVTNRTEAVDLFGSKIEKDMQVLDKMLDKASPTGPMFMNKPINELKRQFNDPELAKLDLQMTQVATEYERLITSGGLSQAQLHRGASEDAKKLLNGEFPPQKARAVMAQMNQDIQNAKKSGAEAKTRIQSELSSLGKKDKGDGAKAPKSGDVVDGYKFKGGDPSKQTSWEKV